MYQDLELSDRARVIALAVKSGITDLRDIESVYNKFAEGGPTGASGPAYPAGIIGNAIKSAVKDVAYKIAVDDEIMRKGNASLKDIARALTTNKEHTLEDDNKRAYIFGTGDRYPEVKEPIQGFDYSNYFKQYGYKDVKDVYGIINPEEEYSIDPEYENLITELAKHNYHFYDNADDMFLDADPEMLGYRDDVGNFIHQLGLDRNGNVVIHDSDVYDFNPADYNYTRGNSKLSTKVQAKLMDMIGHPYTIRQENQPVIFDGNYGGQAWNITGHLDDMTDQDIARATESGFVPKSVVTAAQKAFGGNLYGDGGFIREFDEGGEKDRYESVVAEKYTPILSPLSYKDFNNYWLSNRQNLLGQNLIDSGLKVIRESDLTSKQISESYLSRPISDIGYDEYQRIIGNQNTAPVNYVNYLDGSLGRYRPSEHEVYLLDDMDQDTTKSVWVHEKTHSGLMDAQEKLIDDYKQEHPDYRINEMSGNDSYYDEPTEIRARLQQLYYELNANPYMFQIPQSVFDYMDYNNTRMNADDEPFVDKKSGVIYAPDENSPYHKYHKKVVPSLSDEDMKIFKALQKLHLSGYSKDFLSYLINDIADSGNRDSIYTSNLGNISENGGPINRIRKKKNLMTKL